MRAKVNSGLLGGDSATGVGMMRNSARVRVERPIRGGMLRDILDEEFQRSYRFEGVSDFISDVKGWLRRVVTRESEFEEVENFPGPVEDRVQVRSDVP